MSFMFAALTSSLHAQATRTWVSGVGDDVNPGSRTAPCKTFAGAISKTAAGGEISVLDPGGFGTVTITKGMTLNGDGSLGSILAAGSNGIVINAGVNDVVTIRNISIKNPGSGIASPSGRHGIRILSAGAVVIDRCSIEGGTDSAIDFQPVNANAKLLVTNSVISRFTETGIKAGPAISGFVTVKNTTVENCKFGVRGETNAFISISDSTISNSSNRGITATATSQICVERSTVSHSSGNGIHALNSGIVAVTGSTVCFSGSTGFGFSGSAQIISFGNNTLFGNNPNGVPSSVVPQN